MPDQLFGLSLRFKENDSAYIWHAGRRYRFAICAVGDSHGAGILYDDCGAEHHAVLNRRAPRNLHDDLPCSFGYAGRYLSTRQGRFTFKAPPEVILARTENLLELLLHNKAKGKSA